MQIRRDRSTTYGDHELGVLELARLLLAELADLHLGLPVVLVVHLLRRRDEVEHVRADEQRTQLAEVAVVLIFDYKHSDVSNTTAGLALRAYLRQHPIDILCP